MRMRIYHFLVNRHAGIRSRYHRVHDNAGLMGKLLSYVYLLWMNFCYYVLLCRSLGEPEEARIFEKKKLPAKDSESALFLKNGLSVDSFAERLSRYDIISFDLFDTLIFRPFSEPGDLFYFLGAETGLLDFKRIRMEQEALARMECYREQGHYEVSLSDIWNHIERDIGISAQEGMAAEKRLEMQFCHANSFMLEVFRRLQAGGKKTVVVSDMYLPGDFLLELLERNGYTGIAGVYVSCEYGKSKRDGRLYETVRNDFGTDTEFVHVGDNEYSDVKMAGKCGFETEYYPNVNKNAALYRPYDMSPMVGGAYRGIVDNHIYCGIRSYSMEYEYGFIYGGLFVLGYCDFIHDYCAKNSVDKVLFLSRDGDILKQAYDYLYPDENTQYVYWSRKAAAKLEAGYDRADYFRRFIFHKVNQGYSIREVLHSMELDFLADALDCGAADGRRGKAEGRTGSEPEREGVQLKKDDKLTDKNAPLLKKYLESNWAQVLGAYREQNDAAKAYYRKVLSGVRKAAAVDIGWAGSGAMALRYLVSKQWGMNCEVLGIIAGTNTIHNADPEASESFLQSGRMAAYLYSQGHNRDLLKKHNLNKDYNIFWELLLSSPTPRFEGFHFASDRAGCDDIELAFGKYDANQEGIREIQRGILDFVMEYRERFREFSYMFHISGRDAYAPMLAAAGQHEKYLKAIARKFEFEVNVE